MTSTLTINHSSLRQSMAATIEALFGDCNEIRCSDAGFDIAAAVGVTGGASATVVVRVDDLLSRRYASEMFDLPEAEVSEMDVADALLELTNVLGGAAKMSIATECVLELPAVVPLDRYPVSDDDPAFEVSGGTISVAIVNGAGAVDGAGS